MSAARGVCDELPATLCRDTLEPATATTFRTGFARAREDEVPSSLTGFNQVKTSQNAEHCIPHLQALSTGKNKSYRDFARND